MGLLPKSVLRLKTINSLLFLLVYEVRGQSPRILFRLGPYVPSHLIFVYRHNKLRLLFTFTFYFDKNYKVKKILKTGLHNKIIISKAREIVKIVYIFLVYTLSTDSYIALIINSSQQQCLYVRADINGNMQKRKT